MKRFEFRFQSVGKVRKIEMERQARVLAEAQMKVKQIEDEIEAIKEQGRREVARIRALALKGEIPEQLTHLSLSYREGLKISLKKKMQELREWEAKVREERDKLIEREKKRKVIEKIRERDLEAYEEERRKDELKRMDEVASRLRDDGVLLDS